jgi:hypothetical protein
VPIKEEEEEDFVLHMKCRTIFPNSKKKGDFSTDFLKSAQ